MNSSANQLVKQWQILVPNYIQSRQSNASARGTVSGRNWLILMVSACFIVGCASGAQLESMVVEKSPGLHIADDSPFKNEIYLESVSGGKKTDPAMLSQVGNPEFKGALRQSLQAYGLLNDDMAASRYILKATLEGLDQPAFGFNTTVTSWVRYQLSEKEKEFPVIDKTIEGAHTATAGDAFYGPERLRLANEGSIKDNIRRFLLELATHVDQ